MSEEQLEHVSTSVSINNLKKYLQTTVSDEASTALLEEKLLMQAD